MLRRCVTLAPLCGRCATQMPPGVLSVLISFLCPGLPALFPLYPRIEVAAAPLLFYEDELFWGPVLRRAGFDSNDGSASSDIHTEYRLRVLVELQTDACEFFAAQEAAALVLFF